MPQISCRPVRQQFDMGNPFLLGALSAFQSVFNKPREEQVRLYADPGFREAVRSELSTRPMLEGMFERMRLLDATTPQGRAEVESGRSIGEIAQDRGASGLETLLDLAVADEGLLVDTEVANFEVEGVRNLLQDGRFLVGLGDGGAHVDMLCDACYPTHLLARWVRDRQALSLEDGVRMLTSVPAGFFGIRDRGRIAEGLAADLVLFDPETVDVHEAEYVDDLPGGGRRLVARADGIGATVVNGRVLMRDGEHAGGLPGQILRSGAA